MLPICHFTETCETVVVWGSRLNALSSNTTFKNPAVTRLGSAKLAEININAMAQGSIALYSSTIKLTDFDDQINLGPVLRHYSTCVCHIVDLGQLANMAGSTEPVMLTTRISYWNMNENHKLAFHGLRRLMCLLTVLSVNASLPEVDFMTAFQAIFPPGGLFSSPAIEIYPHTLLVLAKHTELTQLVSRAIGIHFDLYFYPEVVVLNYQQSTEVVQGQFFCWYCETFRQSKFHLKIYPFLCDQEEGCGGQIDNVIAENLPSGGGQWNWGWSDMLHTTFSINGHGDPFNRHKSRRLDMSVVGFLYGAVNSTVKLYSFDGHYPEFKEITRKSLGGVPWGRAVHVVYASTTSRVVILTTAGVYHPMSSHNVYFKPFTGTVWACVALVMAMAIVIAAAESCSHDCTCPSSWFSMLYVVGETIFWNVSVAMGQYKDASIPKLLGKAAKWSLKIVTTFWLITSALHFNIYQAIFNSDSSQLFPFVTDRKELADFQNATLYLLWNNRLCAEYYKGKKHMASDYVIPDATACFSSVNPVFPECKIHVHIESIVQEALTINPKGHQKNPHSKADSSIRVLRGILQQAYILCNGPLNIMNLLKQRKSHKGDIIFATYDYDFGYNWNVFTGLMGQNQELMLANNYMDFGNQFGVQPKGYIFWDGPQRNFGHPFVDRLKLLVSSGIYGLWEKWDQIKFSQSSIRLDNEKYFQGRRRPTALSFQNSGVSWLFAFMAVAWVIVSLIFSIEITVQRIQRPVHKRNDDGQNHCKTIA